MILFTFFCFAFAQRCTKTTPLSALKKCTPPGFFQDNALPVRRAFRFSLNFWRDWRAFHWLARELQ
ncbi:hypothetical protein BN132_3670 [Cronobacter turicensis 564]|nr:hypothetical protein BN132_3670 [Cronobacter turicensis 564]